MEEKPECPKSWPRCVYVETYQRVIEAWSGLARVEDRYGAPAGGRGVAVSSDVIIEAAFHEVPGKVLI